MSIKILGGFARGQLLDVPKGNTTRPTSVMLRRKIFDYFQNLSGVVFVDLCGGTGAMGFEAWSRGAEVIYLNEINRSVMKTLESNKENLILKNSHKKNGEIFCSHQNALQFLVRFQDIYSTFSKEQKENTVIFLDPPYGEIELYRKVIALIKEESWYFGQLWIESDLLKGISIDTLESLPLSNDKLFSQGDSFIFITNFPQS